MPQKTVVSWNASKIKNNSKIFTSLREAQIFYYNLINRGYVATIN